MPTDAEKEFYNKKDSRIAQYQTIEFTAADIDSVRLVANQPFDKQFVVDGVSYVFRGVSMSLPAVTSQESSTNTQGTVNFGRIANELYPILRNRDPLLSHNPIKAIIRNYKEGQVTPLYTRTLYVPKDGIAFNQDSVSIRLAIDNAAKISIPTLFFDPDVWIGLKLI